MKSKDNRIDLYISKAPEYAKPLLTHLRSLIHKACPEAEETWKWSFPHFDYKNEMMCSMAAFKNHCAFGFWKASIMSDPDKILTIKERESMGHMGQIKSLADLPPDKIIIKYIKEAMRLNDEGIKLPSKAKSSEKKELIIPDFFTKILSKNKTAQKVFDDFSYSHKKEYVMWVTEAKTEDTKNKRMETAIEWLSEGKKKNWKYEKC
ncbi:MAG TPA: YdeI/OmpD-associated family protein [Ignavibacteria bacterium]|nr:YdeI/OmpD-associated family protein [Ignavibacteria bacterium]